MSKQYEPGTIGSVLEDRLADLLDHETIDRDMFVPLVCGDLKQDGIVVSEPSDKPDNIDYVEEETSDE